MVESISIIRKVDRLGRLVLPVEARHALGIEEKDVIEILVDKEDGKILLQKGFRECLKCRSTENLKEIKSEFYICND